MEDIQDVISKYNYFMDKQKIDSIIRGLSKEKKSTKLSKILTEYCTNNKE